MTTEGIRIVDYGRGPQLSNSRLTVLDVFYYLHRGYDFEFIHRAMPTLTCTEFEAVVAYVNEHATELGEKDRLIEERNQRAIAEQKARGLYREIDHSVPVEERANRLMEKVRQRLREHAETNGGHAAH